MNFEIWVNLENKSVTLPLQIGYQIGKPTSPIEMKEWISKFRSVTREQLGTWEHSSDGIETHDYEGAGGINLRLRIHSQKLSSSVGTKLFLSLPLWSGLKLLSCGNLASCKHHRTKNSPSVRQRSPFQPKVLARPEHASTSFTEATGATEATTFITKTQRSNTSKGLPREHATERCARKIWQKYWRTVPVQEEGLCGQLSASISSI